MQYREYLGAPNNIHSYDSGDSGDFPEIEIADDFGPRKLDGNNYNWHGGIDYNNTEGTDNTDANDLILSLQAGQVVNSNGMMLRTRYITIDGDGVDGKNFSYLHLFTEGTLPRISGGCTLMKMNFPDEESWCIVFDNNLGAVYAIGQVTGTVNYDDQDIPVGNTVAAGEPVGPLGTSGPGGYHMHLTVLENPMESPYADNIANNPLEFISYEEPSYDIELLFEDDNTSGVDVTYPGTDFMTIQARVKLDGYNNNARRYNEIYDVENLYFWVKPSYANVGEFKQLQGPFYDQIQLGGKEGNTIIPANMWQDGSSSGEANKVGGWNLRTGIEPNTYAGANEMPHPWDDFYFYDFVSRIHKDDIIGDNNINFRADTPNNSRFNDGVHDIFCEVVNIKGNSTAGETSNFTLDNFQPFLTNFSLSTDLTPNALTFAEFNRSQDENGATLNNGLVINQSSFAETNEFTESFILSVLTSEPMESMQFRYSFESGPNTAWANMTVDANDPLKWNVEVEDNFGCYLFNFRGEDKSGNPLINVHDLTNENTISESVLIPTRLSNTSWVNNPTIVGEDFYSVCTIPACESQIEDNAGSGGSVSDCEDINQFDPIAYVDCQGNYFVELDGLGDEYFVGWLNEEGAFKLGDANHPASIGQNCYVIENENGCCSFQGCIEVTGEERYADNFTYRLTDGPLGTKSIFISTGADGLNFPIMIKVIDANGNDFCSRLISSSEEEASCIGIEIGESYCVEYTDASGCVYESCFTTPGESCPDPIFVTADNITPECEKSYNGAINILIEGNSCERYVVKWDNEWEIGEFGQNEFQLTGLKTGNYCVTVADINCDDCETSTCFVVPEIPQPCESGNCQEALANEVLIETEFIFFNTLTNSCEGGSFKFDATGSSVFPVNISVSQQSGDGCIAIGTQISLTELDPSDSYAVNCFDFNNSNCAGEYCFNVQRAGCPVTTFCRTIEYCEGKSRGSKEIACFVNGDGGQGGSNTGKENLEIAPPITGDNPVELGLEKTAPLEDNTTLTLAKIYPNPFTTDINIQLESIDEQTVQVELTDIYGRTVIREIQELTKGVNLIRLQPSNNLASGIYALTIIDQHQKKYTQLITRMNN